MIEIRDGEAIDVPVISIRVKTDITKNLHALARHHGLLKETVALENQVEVDDIEIAKRIAFLLNAAWRQRKCS